MWWYGFLEFSSPIETTDIRNKNVIYQLLVIYIKCKYSVIEREMVLRLNITHPHEAVEKQDVDNIIGYCLSRELPL